MIVSQCWSYFVHSGLAADIQQICCEGLRRSILARHVHDHQHVQFLRLVDNRWPFLVMTSTFWRDCKRNIWRQDLESNDCSAKVLVFLATSLTVSWNHRQQSCHQANASEWWYYCQGQRLFNDLGSHCFLFMYTKLVLRRVWYPYYISICFCFVLYILVLYCAFAWHKYQEMA